MNVGRDGSNDYKYVVDNFSITKTDDMPVTSPEEEVDSYTREISFHTDGQYPSRTAIHAGSAVKRRIKYVPSEQGIQEKVTALLALHGIDADELESSDVNIYYDSSDSSKVEVTFERPYKNGINAERYMIQGDIIRYSRGTLCSSSRFHVFEEMPFVLDAHELIGVIRNIKAVVSPKYN
ncbi:TPA: hypothetical protein HA246_03585 [Candidatus Woesearchaeota archaeon]|nr:hypothetical protein [Candidatus Woesearchaeota archaeon]